MPVVPTEASPDASPETIGRGGSVRLAETVYRELRGDIFDFRLLPGDRFAENDVAERLQVSRTPVREALMRLQSEGLVRGYFRNGWEVVPIDFSRFAALYELREMIELHAIRRLCAKPTDGATSDVLRRLGATWCAPAAQRLRDGLAVASIDEIFHLTLVGAARNPETDAVYRQATERIRIMRRLEFAYTDCIDDTYDDHVAILHAVAQGDEDSAVVLLRRHIQESHSVVHQLTIERLEMVRSQRALQSGPAPGKIRRSRFG